MFAARVAPQMLAAVALCLSFAAAAAADEAAQREFERGFFLQVHQRDPAAAAAAYDKVAASPDAPAALRDEASRRAAACHEDALAADLARLMPADAIAYAEVTQPGKHAAQLARMLGLVRQAPAAGAQPAAGEPIPLDDGFVLPAQPTISPALLAEIEKFQGAAVAVTSIDPRRGPDGLAVVHPGESNLLRGLLETGVQFVRPTEPIGGFTSYSIAIERDEQIHFVATRRLWLASRSRQPLVDAVARLGDPQAASLAGSKEFQSLRQQREGSLAFVYLNGPKCLEAAAPLFRDRDAALVRAIAGLDDIESVSLSAATTDKALTGQARVKFRDGTQNLMYALVRTAPITGRSLAHVPSGTAVVGIIGLNPADPAAAGKAAARDAAATYITGMDLGREVFNNIEEITVFVSPGPPGEAGRPAIPEVGLVMAVKDAAKSEALWKLLLSLPARFGSPGPQPKEIEIDGNGGYVFQYPLRGMPPVAVVRLKDQTIVAGTQRAATAAVRADGAGGGIRGDAAMKPLVDALTPNTSKAGLVHVGRALEMYLDAAASPREAEEIRPFAPLLADLTLLGITDEQPTELVLRGQVAGLPDVPRLAGAMFQQYQRVEIQRREAMRAALEARARAAQQQAIEAQRRAEQQGTTDKDNPDTPPRRPAIPNR